MWTPTTRAQHSRTGLRYGCDLADAEWAILGPFLPCEAGCGRKRAYPMREVVNAICYFLRAGIAWRVVRDTFPSWRSVCCWFARLHDDGSWETITITWSCATATGSAGRPAPRPKRRARALTLSCYSCIARRTASVVRAHPWRTWPIAHPSQRGGQPLHHTQESEI